MEDLYNPEELILCPYNSSHRIRRCRMSFHLVKCKKSYGEQKMLTCDFNVCHIIPEPELKFHHQICPDRRKLEAQIVESYTHTENKYPIPDLDCGSEENWDNMNAPTYDPKKYTENHDILRQLDVESGAKRKNFRLNERQRLASLNNQNNTDNSKEERVKLPPHRNVTNVVEERFDPSDFERKLRLDNEKVFVASKVSAQK